MRKAFKAGLDAITQWPRPQRESSVESIGECQDGRFCRDGVGGVHRLPAERSGDGPSHMWASSDKDTAYRIMESQGFP